MIGIYRITNPKGKIYVGKSINIEKRFKSYRILSSFKTQRKLYNSIKLYGIDNHKFEIIEECNEELLNTREIYWIKKLQAISKGLNLTKGGDGIKLCPESQELRRLKSMKPILQYDLDGNFIKEHKGASDAAKDLGKKQGNNINDCARGKYHSTYGFMWIYKTSESYSLRISPPQYKDKGSKWTEERRLKYKNSRKGEKRSLDYSNKISKLKQKPVYQFDTCGKIAHIFSSFGEINKSGVIGTTKLRKIINKDEYYKGYRYSYDINLKFE